MDWDFLLAFALESFQREFSQKISNQAKRVTKESLGSMTLKVSRFVNETRRDSVWSLIGFDFPRDGYLYNSCLSLSLAGTTAWNETSFLWNGDDESETGIKMFQFVERLVGTDKKVIS